MSVCVIQGRDYVHLFIGAREIRTSQGLTCASHIMNLCVWTKMITWFEFSSGFVVVFLVEAVQTYPMCADQ